MDGQVRSHTEGPARVPMTDCACKVDHQRRHEANAREWIRRAQLAKAANDAAGEPVAEAQGLGSYAALMDQARAEAKLANVDFAGLLPALAPRNDASPVH